MVVLIGLALAVLTRLGSPWPARRARVALAAISGGMLAYYGFGLAFAAVEAHQVSTGGTFAHAVSSLEPWAALALVPAALVVLTGFWAYAAAAWQMNGRQFELSRRALAAMPSLYTGRIPRRVQRRSPAALAGYELPLGLLGFPGVGWLFAGFPFIGIDPAACRTGARVGRRPDRFQPVRGRTPARHRVEGRARLSSRERDCLGCSPLPSSRTAPVPRCWAILRRQALASPAAGQLSHPRERRRRDDSARSSLAALRACARRAGVELGSLHLPTAADFRGDGTVPLHTGRPGQALLLERPAEPVSRGCPSHSCGPSWRSRGARRGP